MSILNSQELLNQLNWRYAVKKFDPNKKISLENWTALEESLRLAPSSYNLQPWKFIIVQNPELREKLVAASWNQSQVKDCSHLVVVAYKQKLDLEHIDKHIKKMSEVRETPIDKFEGYRTSAVRDLIHGTRAESIHWWAEKQCYIAMGFLLEAAAMIGVDTCPIEGIKPDEYDKILKLEGTGYKTLVTIACGYRHPEDKYQSIKKVRFDSQDVIQYL